MIMAWVYMGGWSVGLHAVGSVTSDSVVSVIGDALAGLNLRLSGAGGRCCEHE